MVQSYATLTAVSLDRAAWYGELVDEQLGMSRERAEAIEAGLIDPSELDEQARHLARLRLGGPAGLEGIIGHTFSAVVVERGDCALDDDGDADEDGSVRRRGGFGKHQHVEMHPTGEAVRALLVLEGQERDRAERLVRNGVKIGIEIQQVEAMRAYGDTMAMSLREFAAELGIDPDDELVARAAVRAVLSARTAQGADEGDPDRDGGPRLSLDERRAVLTRALPMGSGA